MDHAQTDRLKTLLLAIALAGLVTGLGLHFSGRTGLAQTAWFAGVVPVLAALVVEIIRSLARGEVGLDIVAALSMSAALTFAETLAAAVVAVMYSGGTFLECAICSPGCRVPLRATATVDWGRWHWTTSRPATGC